VTNAKSFTGSGDTVQKVADTASNNNHARLQTTMPAWYLPPSNHRRWSLNAAIITSSQFDMSLRQNYSINDDAFVDIGPAVTYAYQFLDNRSLSVGITGHLTYRVATDQPYTIGDLLQGRSFALSSIGNQGTMIDFDLGTTKIWNWRPLGIEVSTAFAINNILGGDYNHAIIKPIKNIGDSPASSNRSFGFGVAGKRNVGILHDLTLGIESYDIGNNTGGSFFRTLHIGAETRLLYVLIPRLGINQGYLTAGLAVDLKFLEIEAATWGEELGLNAGDSEDRRFGLRFSIHL
jgi:hypothetical protein